MMAKSTIVGVRLTPEQLEAIDSLIESGEFEDRSEFIRYVVRKFLKAYSGRCPPVGKTFPLEEQEG